MNAETQAKHDGEMNGECSSSSSGGAWESKLSDVVKGVAKAKAAHNHHHPNHLQAQKPLLNGPPALAVTVNVAATVTSSIPKGLATHSLRAVCTQLKMQYLQFSTVLPNC